MRSIFTPGEHNYDRSLDDLLPVRIVNAANARGLYTLREFLTLPPAAFTTERNIGRKTLVDTERAILRTLGSSWQEAWSKLKGPATRTSLPPAAGPADGESAAARWSRLALYPQLARFTVDELPLPTRMKNHAQREHIVSAADLVKHGWAALLQTDQLGRGTMHKSLEVLEDALATASRPDPLTTATHWRAAMLLALGELDADLRSILTRRAGLAGDLPTLAQLGEELGVSRERVRQKEERAKDRLRARLSRLGAREKLRALMAHPLTPVTLLDDPFFAVDPEDEPAYAIFIEALSAAEVHLARIDDRLFLTRVVEAEARALWERVEQAAEQLAYPFPEHELAARLADAVGCESGGAELLVRVLGARFLRHGAEIHGYGTRREDGVLAYLRAQPGPVHRSELETHLGRGAWPDDVVLIDRGLLTLRERIPGWETWVERAGQLVARAMREQAPDRHWTTYELVPVLAEQAEMPTWLNAWSLGALLRESEHTQYLGRNVVALAGEPEVRANLVDSVRLILERAGGPLPEKQVHDAILQSHGLTETTWSLLRLRAPFVLLGDSMLGLAPRDVPGGAEALEHAVYAVAGALHEEQVGWDRQEVERFVRELGAPWDNWGHRLTRSVLRLAGVFRLTRAGGIGLAEWEDARVPIRVAREPLRAREPTSAEVRASLLERWLISLPERSAPLARELVNEEHPELAQELDAWREQLLQLSTHEAIEPVQVARLLALAGELASGDYGRRLTPLVHAALIYVCRAAAERNAPRVGMLDDDEAVLSTTRDLCAQYL